MQTIQFIQTARWIKEQFSQECYSLLFEAVVFSHREREANNTLEGLLKITHELTAVWPVLVSNALAVEILHEFDLYDRLSASTAITTAISVISSTPDNARKDPEQWVYGIRNTWNILCSCLDPLEKLTTPVAVSKEEAFDEIFTVELRVKKDVDPPVKVISEVLTSANGIYDDMCKLMCIKDKKELTALYGTSGSSFRFDFTGCGEVIKELKKLIVELWDKCRYSDADKLRSNFKVTAEGLKLLEDIKDKRNKNAINNETANKLAGKITLGICKLFQNGATIREIDSVVTVSNQNLLEHLSEKKLLPKPATPEVAKKKAAKKAKKEAAKKKEE